jgi:hypothetical protein
MLKAKTIVALLLLVLSTGCELRNTSAIEFSFDGVEGEGYFRKEEIFTEKQKVAIFQSVKWLDFSLTEHEEERNIICSMNKELFEEIEDVYENFPTVNIYICMEDIDYCGKEEVIAFLEHPFYCGSKANGVLVVYPSGITNNGIVVNQCNLDLKLEYNIGVIEDPLYFQKTFYVNGRGFRFRIENHEYGYNGYYEMIFNHNDWYWRKYLTFDPDAW